LFLEDSSLERGDKVLSLLNRLSQERERSELSNPVEEE